MRRHIMLIVFTLILIAGGFGLPGVNGIQDRPSAIDDPEPFAIELPEIGTGLLKARNVRDISIPSNSKITRLILWVLQPYNQRFGYQINASLNGKALGTVSQKKSGRYGNFLDVNLTLQPGLLMTAGKNVLELTAYESESRLTCRASFVISVGGRQTTRQNPDSEPGRIRYEKVLASSDSPVPNDDRTAPEVVITEPATAPEAADEVFTLRVSGFATDDSGRVATISLNGRVIASAPAIKPDKKKKGKDREVDQTPPGERKLEFDSTVRIESNVDALLLEARDETGNRALAYIPINRQKSLAEHSRFGGRRYAVLVGVSQYQFNEGGLTDLDYPDRDAEAMRQFLRSPGGGAFKDEDIVCLTNQNATLHAVRDSLERFLTRAGENDLIYLFLAGHGAPDPYDRQKLYFLLSDSKVTDLPRTAFPMAEIGDFLAKHKKQTRLIAFFDTCHSAGISGEPLKKTQGTNNSAKDNRGIKVTKKDNGKSKSTQTASAPAVETQFNFYNSSLYRDKGWTIITSSRMDELSQESREWGGGHGVFTWAILEGAGGKADSNGDCRITASELASYVDSSVRQATGGAQTPQTLPGSSRDLVIAARPGCERSN